MSSSPPPPPAQPSSAPPPPPSEVDRAPASTAEVLLRHLAAMSGWTVAVVVLVVIASFVGMTNSTMTKYTPPEDAGLLGFIGLALLSVVGTVRLKVMLVQRPEGSCSVGTELLAHLASCVVVAGLAAMASALWPLFSNKDNGQVAFGLGWTAEALITVASMSVVLGLYALAIMMVAPSPSVILRMRVGWGITLMIIAILAAMAGTFPLFLPFAFATGAEAAQLAPTMLWWGLAFLGVACIGATLRARRKTKERTPASSPWETSQ